MRPFSALILLITLMFSIFSPLTVQLTISPESRATFLVTLDVCHASGAALSVSSEMPFLCEGTVSIDRLETTRSHVSENESSFPLLIPYPEERPPRV